MPRPINRDELEVRTERLAVNLQDLDRLPDAFRLRVAKVVDPKPVMTDGGNVKEVAVEFSCLVVEAAAICDLLRSNDREVGDVPTRVYLRKREAWVRVPADRSLTTMKDGKLSLSAELFCVEVEAAKPVPLVLTQFRFGG